MIACSYTRFGTLGSLTGPGIECRTLELPWAGNERNESCIPPGVYQYQRHESPRFGETLWLRGAPERSEILIHAAKPDDGNDYYWDESEQKWVEITLD